MFNIPMCNDGSWSLAIGTLLYCINPQLRFGALPFCGGERQSTTRCPRVEVTSEQFYLLFSKLLALEIGRNVRRFALPSELDHFLARGLDALRATCLTAPRPGVGLEAG